MFDPQQLLDQFLAQGAAERGYLSQPAARLRLEPGPVEHLHASIEPVKA